MAKKKVIPKRKAQITSSPKPSMKKKSLKAIPKKKSVKSKKSKKSSALKKPLTYKLITLDPKTLKPTKAVSGKEIFYAWKDSNGKINKLPTHYSQKFSAVDKKSIEQSFKKGSPRGYPIYQKMTREIIYEDVEGIKVPKLARKGGRVQYETVRGKLVPIKLRKYKLTGFSTVGKRKAQIYRIDGYVAPMDVGFKKLEKKQKLKNLILIPVHGKRERKGEPYHVFTKPILISTAQIKDTIQNIRPDITVKQMVRRKFTTLFVQGHIYIPMPSNPYSEKNEAYLDYQKWIDSIWQEHKPLSISYNKGIDYLANFSDALSVEIRERLSLAGLRLTSLVHLREIEIIATKQDEEKGTNYADKIIDRPLGPLSFTKASSFKPLRYEDKGSSIFKPHSKKQSQISFDISIEARQ